jgi:hypothetical protein
MTLALTRAGATVIATAFRTVAELEAVAAEAGGGRVITLQLSIGTRKGPPIGVRKGPL